MDEWSRQAIQQLDLKVARSFALVEAWIKTMVVVAVLALVLAVIALLLAAYAFARVGG